jgi:hypothetical protein
MHAASTMHVLSFASTGKPRNILTSSFYGFKILQKSHAYGWKHAKPDIHTEHLFREALNIYPD